MGLNIIDKEVDHINRDKFDNRRCNLRVATGSQNSINVSLKRNNTSGYKGVSWNNQSQKYRTRINVNKRVIYLGSYDNPEDAAKAYDKAAKKYFGEFAYLNFP